MEHTRNCGRCCRSIFPRKLYKHCHYTLVRPASSVLPRASTVLARLFDERLRVQVA
jgi:hypothetical protein